MKDRFAGNKLNKVYDLVCIDERLLKAFKGMYAEVLKKLATTLMSGRSPVGMSLSVRIFEPESLISRVSNWWALYPHYLNQATKTNDPIERFRLLIAALIGGMHMGISQWKPFNPILGETFQAEWKDGTKLACEHISHHPPITAFNIHNPGYRVSGSLELIGGIGKNHLEVSAEGRQTIKFADGQTIIWYNPFARLGGLIFGERSNKIQGSLVMYDQKNGLKAVIKFDAGSTGFLGMGKKRSDILRGELYKTNHNNPMPFYKTRKAMEKDNIKMKDKAAKIDIVEGSWLSQCLIGSKEYWNLKKQKPERISPIENPLPFDCRFREDLLYLKYGDQEKAAVWKHQLEEQQRHERKLRQAYAKEHKLVYDK